MAYPDSWHWGKDPSVGEIVQVFETIPLHHTGQPYNTDKGMIHFDLDTQNCTWVNIYLGQLETNMTERETCFSNGGRLRWHTSRHSNCQGKYDLRFLQPLLLQLELIFSQIGDLGLAESYTLEDRRD